MKNIAIAAFLAVGCLALVGCNLAQQQPTPPTPAAVGGTAPHLVPRDEKTAMERVNELTDKCVELSEKRMKLQNENETLRDKNRVLIDASAKAQAELVQAKKELADANVMLDELTADLQRWKENVLGFREEMRKAQAVELQKLVEIIRFLGGEVPDGGGKTVVNTDKTKKVAIEGGTNG